MPVIEIEQNPRSKACVICPVISAQKDGMSCVARLEEAVGLARAINLDVVHREIVRLREVKPGTFISQGILDNLIPVLAEKNVELLIVDNAITPIQQRNLEKKLNLKVIDRTALILEIFGERAQTKEGKLQVELAHLTYQRSRLVRSWTHLERQRGGAGFLGGPGETQIELDRRIIDEKIVRIKKDLEKVRQTRLLQRGARQRVPYPVVALVGYTNAGKSSVFNRLSAAGVFAENLLFATLDNTLRKIVLPSGREVILSDTVGFISDLPHELIMSFRATLEEVLEADIVVHVRDISNENSDIQKKDVLSVLKSLGLDEIEHQDCYIELLNKIDLLDGQQRRLVEETKRRSPGVLPVSALTGEGCKEFLDLLDKRLSGKRQKISLSVENADGALAAWIYRHAEVLSAVVGERQTDFKILIEPADLQRLRQKTKLPFRTLG